MSKNRPITEDGIELRTIPLLPKKASYYRAGSDGQVYTRLTTSGKTTDTWRPLVGGYTSGYRRYSLCVDTVRYYLTAHRCVCSAFHGLPECKTLQVRHLDGDRKNNLPSNLAWGTQQQNWIDRVAHGRGMDGEKHHMAKFTDEEMRHIHYAVTRNLVSQWHASKILGVSQSAIGTMVKRVDKWQRSGR